jgi:outer membrane protein OmpA-like peptidoglycan-associated protein
MMYPSAVKKGRKDMKRHPSKIIGLLFLILLLCIGSPGIAEEKGKVLDLTFKVKDMGAKVLDLKFKVEDMGGKVQNLRIKETPTEIHIELASDVLFDFDKADIKPQAAAALKQVAFVIRDKAIGVVRIEGHTDSKGSNAYNLRLSRRRADSVKTWLIHKENLENVAFRTRGFGAKRPIAPNTKPDGSDNPEGRQKNRRVEIILKK